MKWIAILWKFSRPHTIIGSTLSIVSLFFLAIASISYPSVDPLLLPLSLLSALCCNIYITGLNQWSDIEVDRINKPWLPIPAGLLTKDQAFRIVMICGIIALVAAALVSWFLLVLIAIIMAIGTAYSLPPLKLKRHHLLAAGAISLVRGLLVNIGFYTHFSMEMTGHWMLAKAVWPLTIFVAAFSLGIAWFKDIPDTEGDAVYHFGTLAVRKGRRKAFYAGVFIVSFAYLYIIAAAMIGQIPNRTYFVPTHVIPLAIFLWQARQLRVEDTTLVKRFYLFFWGLFFLEYLVYPTGFFLEG